jgi:GTP-binding protein
MSSGEKLNTFFKASNYMNLKFVSCSASLKDCPDPKLPEFAFIGRSNVGKSSLINMLSGRKSLAKISSNPGKTRTINHYIDDDASFYLVDLPGYGFSRLSKKEISALDNMIHSYILKRQNLKCIFVLIDSRHEPLRQDINFLTWLARHEKKFFVLFTKSDKNSKTGLAGLQANYLVKAQAMVPGLVPGIIPTSSVTRQGKEEVISIIKEMLIT